MNDTELLIHKMDDIKVGVYLIDIEEINACYVGESMDVYNRWKQHCTNLKNRKHHNQKLQALFNHDFKLNFSIIEESPYVYEHATYLKLFNLREEEKYIRQLRSVGIWVCNKELSYTKIDKNPEIKCIKEEFESYNIQSYNDIFDLKDEPHLMWEYFSERFYDPKAKNRKVVIDFKWGEYVYNNK